MSDRQEGKIGVGQYRTLGLVANPFVSPGDGRQAAGTAQSIAAQSNRLLSRIVTACTEEQPRPIRVDKTTEIPAQYPNRAISAVEHTLIHDDGLNVVHGYTQLYMMRRGRVRATLAAVGERIAFRSFDRTLAAWVARVLETPDTDLGSYAVLGPERLDAFKEEFAADPVGAVLGCFGALELERQPDLGMIADVRLNNLDPDVDEEQDMAETDSTVGNALGTTPDPSGEGAEQAGVPDDSAAVVDYIVEYTSVHLSSVIGRALRVFKDRGLAAMSTEFRVTKAPRKTLAALVRFARCRFDRIVLIFDGFEGWANVPHEIRGSIAATFTEMRWQLAGDVVIVMMLDEGRVPELEEQFAAASAVAWDFSDLAAAQEAGDTLDMDLVAGWLKDAAADDGGGIAVDDPVIAHLAETSGGSTRAFVTMARAAIDSAAMRGVGRLDDEAREAGLAAVQGE